MHISFYVSFKSFNGVFVIYCSDRSGKTVSQNVLHGVINSFVYVQDYKKKSPLKVINHPVMVDFVSCPLPF